MAAGNRLIVQDDFSAGAFPSTSFENIPGNGVADAVNLLVDDDRSLKGRGGSRWAAPAMAAGTYASWLWSGILDGVPRTIITNPLRVSASDDLANTTTTIAATVPAAGPAVQLAGLLFLPGGATLTGALGVGTAARVAGIYAVAGNRLWAADHNARRIDFSDVGAPGTFGPTSFHEIPEGGITGAIGLRDAVVVFTSEGVWVISNVGLNLTDADGNVQHRIDRYSRSIVLWHRQGLGAAYEGALVVPARDGVYLLSYGVASEAPQQFTLISRPIANLYRSYVAAGHIPGQPVVRRGTLFLPIRTPAGAAIDLLVCKLDAADARGRPTFPWTRIAHGATAPLTLAESVHTGNLIGGGVGGDRLMTLDYFDAATSVTDADGGAFTALVSSRSPVPPTRVATLTKFRLGYELALGSIAGTYVDREGVPVALTPAAPANAANLAPHLWRVGQRARYSTVTMAYTPSGAPFIVRSFEWFVRDRGRV